MKDHSALSQQLIDSGYLDSLCEELQKLAYSKFITAKSDDLISLSHARIAADSVEEIRQIVKQSANSQK